MAVIDKVKGKAKSSWEKHRITVYLLLLVIFTSILSSIFMGCGLIERFKPQKAPEYGEVRGVWLTTTDSNVLSSAENIHAAMKRLAEHGFNVVYPVVWSNGYTTYPSHVMERYFGEEYGQNPEFARLKRDPLAELVQAAHANGLKVIPWFEYGFASAYEKNDHILTRYPDWAGRDQTGKVLVKNGFRWMNAFDPRVQAFMLALIKEVLDTYAVDGIQGDDRLPALPSTGGYDVYTTTLYKRENGGKEPPADIKDPAWIKWRADKLSDFGGKLYRLVKEKDPNLIVSLAPSVYPWSLEAYLQDWPTWIQRGQVDLLHPQCYRHEIVAYQEAVAATVAASGLDLKQRSVIFAPAILIKTGDKVNSPAYVRQALAFNRRLGLHGEAFFFYEGLWEKNQNLADSLSATFYKTPRPFPLLLNQVQ